MVDKIYIFIIINYIFRFYTINVCDKIKASQIERWTGLDSLPERSDSWKWPTVKEATKFLKSKWIEPWVKLDWETTNWNKTIITVTEGVFKALAWILIWRYHNNKK